jgi:hypothetical protein
MTNLCACGCGKEVFAKNGQTVKWYNDSHRTSYNGRERRKAEKLLPKTELPERKCAREKCDVVFVPENTKRQYCSMYCAQRGRSAAEEQRKKDEYAAKKREQRKLARENPPMPRAGEWVSPLRKLSEAQRIAAICAAANEPEYDPQHCTRWFKLHPVSA